MINKLKTTLTSAIKNSRGFRTPRKLVVFESDDWGSIRMPSMHAYNLLTEQGLNFNSPGGFLFNKFDTLAGEDDLHALFEVLDSVRDSKGNSAVFTAVTCVCNPKFDLIREDGFNKFYYEPFTETLARYYPNNNPWKLWQDGINAGMFIPQSHSREHLNVRRWMKNLKAGDKNTIKAFEQGCWCFNREEEKSYQVAFDIDHLSDLINQKIIISEGLEIFEKIFGKQATFFVPPNGILHPKLEDTLHNKGIKFLYSSFKHSIPDDNGKLTVKFNYLGKKNKHNQRYIIRNCIFEPNQPGVDWAALALKQIETAFKWNKPAVLGPHRKNFIGQHYESNRKEGLKSLKLLLKKIVKKWPEVEFISSDELGTIIKNE